MSSTSGRCNSAERGSSYDRRSRKLWLLSVRAGWGGDGETVPCWDCGVLCEYEDLVADRIIPGERGGTYCRDNIAPHCLLCSCRQGQRRTVEVVRLNREKAAA
ncbi:HNH endonuclease [Mycobacterium phage Thonko]|uniref:HNH endonuclease n=1 Tax=Mycobacterium phage Thonko TaxID=2282910 RepID=A0A346FCD2_9CAUD|nr:HNH endonuclease [Mycobacterium phage Thonko]AXN53357.1 HNH endonuclease [Mycobacterium phage Thonko]